MRFPARAGALTGNFSFVTALKADEELPPLIINILPELPALGCQVPPEHSSEESLIDYEDVR